MRDETFVSARTHVRPRTCSHASQTGGSGGGVGLKLTTVAFKARGMLGMNNEYNNTSLHFRSSPPHRWRAHSDCLRRSTSNLSSLRLFRNCNMSYMITLVRFGCFETSPINIQLHSCGKIIIILVSDRSHQGQSQDEPRGGQESRCCYATSNAIAL